MANDLPDFIPKESPDFFLTDLSHTISATSIDSLKPTVAAAHYAPKVVILPADYVSPSSAQLTQNLVKQWNINANGKTLLVVVDLKGHKVHAHGSPELAKTGITSDYISNSLIPNQFIPSMKKGDLTNAIRLTLTDVSQKESGTTLGSAQTVANIPAKVPVQPMSDTEVNIILVVLAIIPIALIWTVVSWMKRTFFAGNQGAAGNMDAQPSVFGKLRSRGFWNGGGHQPLGSWSSNPANDYDSNHSSSSSSDSSSSSSSSSSDSSSGSDGSGSW